MFSAVPFSINKIDRKIDVQRYFIAFLLYCRMSNGRLQVFKLSCLMFIFINANVSDKNVK